MTIKGKETKSRPVAICPPMVSEHPVGVGGSCTNLHQLTANRSNTTESVEPTTSSVATSSNNTAKTKGNQNASKQRCNKYYVHIYQRHRVRNNLKKRIRHGKKLKETRTISPKNNALMCKQQQLPSPLVDGKIVAMLRRVGTTLSTDSNLVKRNEDKSPRILPKIMSPAKPQPLWTRHLDEDEVEICFDDSIYEIIAENEEELNASPIKARRKLSFSD